jgi:hypothetical protein
MAAREVVKDTENFLRHGFKVFFNTLRQGSDGPYYLHVLDRFEHILSSESEEEDRSSCVIRCNSIAQKIQARFDSAVDNPRHFKKVQWFAKYWDESVGFAPDVVRLRGPGVDR